jgi:hypothetical protein
MDLTFVLLKTKQCFVCVTSWALNKSLGENILGKSAAPHPLLALHQKKKKIQKNSGENDYLFRKKGTLFPTNFFFRVDHRDGPS